MTSITLEKAIDRFGVSVDEHLPLADLVPIVEFGRQGDVIVVPSRITAVKKSARTPVPTEGVAVVRGENGGNTHLLLAEGDVRFDGREASVRDLALGILTVAKGAIAYLAHPEHGYVGFGPGDYTISRQREQADEQRLVHD